MPRVFRFAVLTLCCLAGGRSVATDYYVSPAGNDNKSGNSPANAWQTINKVNTVTYVAGDRIFFEGGGTFAGKIYFDPADGGSATNPIVVTSYGTGRATIDGGTNNALFAWRNGGFTISNLNFVGAGATSNASSGLNFYNDLAGNVKKDHIYIDNVDVSGFGQGIVIGGFNGISGYRDVRVTHCELHHNQESGLSTYGMTFTNSLKNYALTNVYVAYCRAYNNDGDPASTGNTGNGIVLGSVDGGVIEYCVAHDNGINNQPTEGPVGLWCYDANNVVIQFNESYHNRTGSSADGDGFDFDQNVSNSILQYNYAHDNDGAGFLVYASSGRSNYNNTVRYNISQNDSRKLNYGGILIAGQIRNLDVYNNTVLITSTNSDRPALKISNISTTPKSVRVRNNILVSRQGTSGLPRLIDSLNDASYVFQGNDYFNQSGAFTIRWAGTNYSTLSAWLAVAPAQERVVTATATNVVALNVDPLLVNPDNTITLNDATLLPTLTAFQLQPASPMRDTGLTLTALTNAPLITDVGARDFYGIALFQGGGFDVGAHEYLPGVAAPTLLSATALSPSAIRLTWQDNATNEIGYAVESAPDRSNFLALASTTSNVVVLTNTGLTADTWFSYRVRATNTVEPSFWSNVASNRTHRLPASDAVSADSSGLLTIQFSGELGQMYELQCSADLAGWTTIATVTNTGSAFSFMTNEIPFVPQRFYRLRWAPKP